MYICVYIYIYIYIYTYICVYIYIYIYVYLPEVPFLRFPYHDAWVDQFVGQTKSEGNSFGRRKANSCAS